MNRSKILLWVSILWLVIIVAISVRSSFVPTLSFGQSTLVFYPFILFSSLLTLGIPSGILLLVIIAIAKWESKKRDLKKSNFFAPNKGKLLYLVLLIILILTSIFLSMMIYFLYYTAVQYSGNMTTSFIEGILGFGFIPLMYIYSCPLIILPGILFLSYFFSCYINTSKKRALGIVLCIVSFFVIVLAVHFALSGYNAIFTHSCTKDSDCHMTCEGVRNYHYIDDLHQQCLMPDIKSYCDNNTCKGVW
jgi:hypothetical protein